MLLIKGHESVGSWLGDRLLHEHGASQIASEGLRLLDECTSPNLILSAVIKALSQAAWAMQRMGLSSSVAESRTFKMTGSIYTPWNLEFLK